MNKTILTGRLVRDPELKRTNSGKSVTSFTLAVDNPVAKNGDKSASFIPVICWNKLAELVEKYCVKGALVAVDGRLSQRNYEDRTGAKRSVVEVIADGVEFLSKKPADGHTATADTTDDGAQAPQEVDEGEKITNYNDDPDLPF